MHNIPRQARDKRRENSTKSGGVSLFLSRENITIRDLAIDGGIDQAFAGEAAARNLVSHHSFPIKSCDDLPRQARDKKNYWGDQQQHWRFAQSTPLTIAGWVAPTRLTLAPPVPVVRKTALFEPFIRIYKRTFYQDRLGKT
jgi:hypothetical protein